MSETLPLPTRRDEAWRYSDIDALAPVWPDIAGTREEIVVAAGDRTSSLIFAGIALSER